MKASIVTNVALLMRILWRVNRCNVITMSLV